MGDSINVDFSPLLKQQDPIGAYVGGLQTGRALGKQNALLSAMQNYDPANSGPTIQALIKSGNVDQAGALSQIQYQQQQRALLGAGLNAFLGGGAGAPAAPATAAAPAAALPTPGDATPAAAPSLPHPSQLNPDQQAHALQTADTFDQLGLQLSQLPYEQRKAALAQETPALVARGLPADQIANFDPTDENIAAVHGQIAQLRSQIAGAGAPDQGVAPAAAQVVAAPGGAPTAPTPGSASPASAIDLRNPNIVRGLEMMQLGGGDIAPLVSLATATTPKVDARRPGSFGYDQYGNITGPRTADGRIMGTPNPDGTVAVFDPKTGGFSVEAAPGGVQAQTDIAQGKGVGEGAARLQFAGPIARATAGGTAAGEAPYKEVEISNPDGSTTKGTLSVVDGKSIFTPIGAGQGTAPGAGTSQPTGEAQYAKDDAAAFSKTIATEADPQTIMGYQRSAATAQQAVNAAMAINPNEFTPKVKQVADVLNGLGLDSSKANDLNYYASIIPQVTRTTFKTFPRLEKEFETVKAAIPGLKTPRDAAALTFASIAATNNQNAAFANFATNYTGPHSQDALNKAWAASPQAHTSIFADPVFKTLTMDGKPAVYINQTPHNGHVYGVFRPGTPNAQTFLVQ